MITGIFEEAFSGREAKEKLRKRWWNRTGMVAAYCLLDRDYDTVQQMKYQTDNKFYLFEYVTQSEFVVNTKHRVYIVCLQRIFAIFCQLKVFKQ